MESVPRGPSRPSSLRQFYKLGRAGTCGIITKGITPKRISKRVATEWIFKGIAPERIIPKSAISKRIIAKWIATERIAARRITAFADVLDTVAQDEVTQRATLACRSTGVAADLAGIVGVQSTLCLAFFEEVTADVIGIDRVYVAAVWIEAAFDPAVFEQAEIDKVAGVLPTDLRIDSVGFALANDLFTLVFTDAGTIEFAAALLVNTVFKPTARTGRTFFERCAALVARIEQPVGLFGAFIFAFRTGAAFIHDALIDCDFSRCIAVQSAVFTFQTLVDE